jgi:hypothetical protein
VDQRIFRGFRRSLCTWREAIGRYKQAQDTEEVARVLGYVYGWFARPVSKRAAKPRG